MQIFNRFIGIIAISILMPILANCAQTTSSTISSSTVWDSTELQTQIGNKNKNKKKLVMRVWHDLSSQQSNGTYIWNVKYYIRAENHDLVGNGWHTYPDLHAFHFHGVVNIPGSGNAPIDLNLDLNGRSSYSGELLYLTNAPPTFLSKTANGSRYGGPSGISINW